MDRITRRISLSITRFCSHISNFPFSRSLSAANLLRDSFALSEMEIHYFLISTPHPRYWAHRIPNIPNLTQLILKCKQTRFEHHQFLMECMLCLVITQFDARTKTTLRLTIECNLRGRESQGRREDQRSPEVVLPSVSD